MSVLEVAVDRIHSLEIFGIGLACDRLSVELSIDPESGNLLASPKENVTPALSRMLLKHRAAIIFRIVPEDALSLQG